MKYILLILTLLICVNAKDLNINVPLYIIKDKSKVPNNSVTQIYKGVKFNVFENDDNTFSIYYKNNKTIKPLKFKFNKATYTYYSNKPIAYAVTTLLERCDGINRAGDMVTKNKNGKLDNFPEKKCEMISQKNNLVTERLISEKNIAKDKEEIAKDKEEIAKEKEEIAKDKEEIEKLEKIKTLLQGK